jgi:hypothetical protein
VNIVAPMLRTRAAAALTAIVIVIAASACGSSSKSSDDPSSSGSTAACPFSGSMNEQKEPSASASATKMESIQPSRAGCIDNLSFNFSPSTAASSGTYSGPTTLVLTFQNATYSGSSPIDTSKLEYVKSATVAASGTATEVTITLDHQRPFDMSSSNVPAYVQVSIG